MGGYVARDHKLGMVDSDSETCCKSEATCPASKTSDTPPGPLAPCAFLVAYGSRHRVCDPDFISRMCSAR